MWYNCTGVLKFLFPKSTILLNLEKKNPFSWSLLENDCKYPNSGFINNHFPDTYIATKKKKKDKWKIKISKSKGFFWFGETINFSQNIVEMYKYLCKKLQLFDIDTLLAKIY